MSSFQDFEKDFEENAQDTRVDFWKLKEGDNEIVILTQPKIYTEVFDIGIVYHGASYAHLGTVKSKAYILDLADNEIKLATFNYPITKDLIALGKGARTKFDAFPMPYSLIINAKYAGTVQQETKVIANEDFVMTPEMSETLAGFEDVEAILDRFKASQQKKVEENPMLQEKIAALIAKKGEKKPVQQPAREELPTISMDDEGESEVEVD